ncbi:uncharacterized mitochondrial protein AtMg00310-like [Juglans regia]|uniref:Uncharacterized mitochondrial protein AtMg00310-like n=1 Tax=Juglans regia TaxID=51240 RepID=A0A6P9EBW0_JUGRE|nr:uncharacterized mitochondrial protein AtMg00310-like [Juglans regia]
MNVFKSPTSLLREIEAMLSQFWWNHNNSAKSIHWRSWERLGKMKDKGGLGFGSLTSFNRALLAKQVWRLLQDPSSLVSQVVKHKYFQNCELLESKIGSSPSHIWRRIWSSIDLVKVGSVWRVGNGEIIKMWHDRWLPIPSTYKVLTLVPVLDTNARVAALINEEKYEWNTELTKEVFSAEDAQLICSLLISQRGAKDNLIWVKSSKGMFNVKSAYFVDLENKRQNQGQSSNESVE